MKVLRIAVLALFAASLLGGCCRYKTKCYPYPLYDYSPARVCGAVPCPAPCPAK
jgi:hypothetical protein